MKRTRRDFLKGSGLLVASGMFPFVHEADGQQPHATRLTAIPTTGLQSLRAHAEARGLLIGCAVVAARLPGGAHAEPEYAATVSTQSNILVAENAMKWFALRPAVDRFNFAEADLLVQFAEKHKQKVRGHNLCWHEGLPAWFAGAATRENARKLLTDHIHTVAGRYSGRMHSWDVVNEAVVAAQDGPGGLRKTPWLDLIGEDYIELAFKTARLADPTALLTYNDYGIELDTPRQSDKRSQVLLLLRRLKARGVPVDAVGVQSHLDATGPRPGSGLRAFVREMKSMGLQVFITELDVSDERVTGSIAERDEAVAATYGHYLGMMLAEANVRAVLTWGITDRYTWIGKEKPRPDGAPPRPLPFDADYHPAPAFLAMRNAIDLRG